MRVPVCWPSDAALYDEFLALLPQVLIFYSMLPNGEFDYTSLHAGCDVIEGVKWSANFWFWNKLHGPTDVAKRLSREIDAQGL
eukprot:5196926-Pleurochrysis_carterae.AAC.1